MPNIQYIKRPNLDVDKWNSCIDAAPNGLIYAYTFYLDAMSDNWDALILNDYEAVMPLPWRKKWGIYYIYQPLLVAQLGLFGNKTPLDMLLLFLQAIPKKFKYLDYQLNFGNHYEIEKFRNFRRRNLTLELNGSYQTIYANYNQNIKRNIKKATRNGYIIKKGIEVKKIINLAKQQGFLKGSDREFQRFEELYIYLEMKGSAKTYATLSESNEILSSAVFFLSNSGAYYILVGNHPNSRVSGGSHLLIDAFIQDHCNSHMILDFEGSDIESLAQFYFSFGANAEYYFAIKDNRLPWYIKWVKD